VKRNKDKPGLTPARPLPNYGRAIAYGIGAAVFGAVFWAMFQVYTGIYVIFLAAVIGWLCGTSVKRGMGVASRPGTWLSFYFTVMTVILGEYLYFAWLFKRAAGHLTLGGPIELLVAYYQADILRPLVMVVFTLTGMVIALIYSR